MTVAAKNPIEVYSGDGVTTAFAARWRYIDTASLKVELISSSGAVTAQTLGVHYTATAGTTDAGGTVTMVTPPAVGQRLRIKRVTPRSQPTKYPTSGAFPASSHELALDRTMMGVQELGVDVADVQGRALQAPDGETIAKLPAASLRIGKMFAFDGSGGGVFDIDADKVRQLIGAVFNPVFTQLASLVMFIASGAGAIARTVQDKLRESASLDDYILDSDPRISGYPDASLAFARAAAVNVRLTGRPGAVYYVKDVEMDGRIFDGRGCVLRDAPGAKFGIALKGYRPELRNFTFQDQGSYVASTTLATPALSGASEITVANAAGIAAGDVIFVDIDANELRWQTFVTSVTGETIGLRDPLPGAAAAGKRVDAMLAAICVRAATDWAVNRVLVVNARGALLTMPPAGQISNKGSVLQFGVDGSRYFGWIKAGDCAGVESSNVRLWNGFVETTTVSGNGTTGPFSFGKRVFLLRDVTVTVNGVARTYGTHWTYASQTSIEFTAGNAPAVGATIMISHFRDGYRGFVEDQRSTSIISGGNVYHKIEALDAFVGASFFESELTEVTSLIADTCQYTGLQLSACPNTLVFTGETFLGYNGSNLKMFGSNPKAFASLYARRVPLAEQWLPSLDDNIYCDATSDLRIAATGWSGEFQNTVAAGGKFSVPGADPFVGRNTANLTAGATSYLCPAGAFAAQGDAEQRLMRDVTLKKLRVDSNAAPGAGQSYTIDVLLGGVSAGQVVLSGAGAFSGTAILNTFGAEGSSLNFRLVTSAGAATGARITAQVAAV